MNAEDEKMLYLRGRQYNPHMGKDHSVNQRQQQQRRSQPHQVREIFR